MIARAARTGPGRVALAVLACAAALADTAPSRAADQAPDERARLLEAIQHSPTNADGFVELGLWLFRTGERDRAISATAEAARLEPDRASHHRLLGYLYAAAGADGPAERAFRRAAELDPSARASLADFHLARAWSEYQAALRGGRPDFAVEERLRAVAAVAEISPELKALVRGPAGPEATEAVTTVPPLFLGPAVRHAIVVEKRTQTLRLFGNRDGLPVLLHTYPCTTGQVPGVKRRSGDLRTPDGVYVVTDLLSGSRLPERYGALALPLNYPNAWDRHLERDGSGIWLHGSDRLGSPFSPRDTRGCVLLRNEDLLELTRLVVPEVTPILIAENVAYRQVLDWQAAVITLLAEHSDGEVLAVAAMPDHLVIIHREGAIITRDFVPARKNGALVAVSERAPAVAAEEWRQKAAQALPLSPRTLNLVRVMDDEAPPRIVIETNQPAEARGFRPEIGAHLYVDLPGVRAAVMPTIVSGDGPTVDRVRIALTNLEPPSTRLVIDLHKPMDYLIEHDGDRIVISLLPEHTG